MREHIGTHPNREIDELSSSFLLPDYRLVLDDFVRLRELGPLSVPSLSIRRCAALARLRDLDVVELDASDCGSLRELPPLGPLMGRLVLRNCAALSELPARLERVAVLDVSGCALLRELPTGLVVTRVLEVGGTSLRALPRLGEGARLRWRGVAVEPDIVLHPERIDAGRVLSEANAELRRVLVERMGYARFIAEVGAEQLHRDVDRGGPRALLRIALHDDEPLVVLSVRCPSTGHQYLLRVPPHVQRCHEAAAWIAGFDEPSRYAPVRET